MKLLLLSLSLLLSASILAQENSIRLINRDTGKRAQIREGRIIIFAIHKHGSLTKARLQHLAGEKMTVVIRKGKRKMELRTDELEEIGIRNVPGVAGGTLLVIGRAMLGKWALSKEYLLFKKYNLSEGWALVPESGINRASR